MGHILNWEKTATNTCIIMLRQSLAKPGNSASKYMLVYKRYAHGQCCVRTVTVEHRLTAAGT